MKKLAVVAAVAFAGACATPKPVVKSDCDTGPEWTCQGSGTCSDKEHKGKLCGVGMADGFTSYTLGVDAAKAKARAEIAATIKVKVDAFTKEVQQVMAKSGLGSDEVKEFGTLTANLVEQTLFGVTVPKLYQNKERNIFFAQAMVDPKALVESLKGMKQAGNLSEEIKAEIEKRTDKLESEWVSERERANPGQ